MVLTLGRDILSLLMEKNRKVNTSKCKEVIRIMDPRRSTKALLSKAGRTGGAKVDVSAKAAETKVGASKPTPALVPVATAKTVVAETV